MNKKVDAITLEVMRNALQSIAEEMGVTLIRTALSTNIKDRRDCSTAVYTADGDLVAQAEHIPLHLGLMPAVIKKVLKVFPKDKLAPGDAIMINDPYISGSHLPDICIFSPVFYENELLAIVANLAHHVDIGGMAPGGMPVNATEIFQEGLRIPPIKIRKAGKLDEDLMFLITNNVRTFYECRGDIEAQLAANNVGERRIKELAQKHGVSFIKEYIQEIMNYSERRMRSKIREMREGIYTFKDYLEIGETIYDVVPICVSLKVKDDQIEVDFTGTGSQIPGSLNCTRAVTLACVYYAIKAMVDPDVPSNAGAFMPVNVITPEGTIVNPRFPAAVSNANINTSQRIADCILGALAKAKPERAMAACSGTMSLFTIGGIDPRTQRYYSYVETYGGGMGAVNNMDGMDGVHTNMTNTRNTPTEVIEIAYPLLVEKYGLIPESEGPGEFRGGLGLTREVVIVDHQAHVTLSTERSYTEPWGLFGGKPGRHSLCMLENDPGNSVKLPARITTTITAGTKIIYQTPGAGGLGLPFKRDPEKVLMDVLNGFITIDRALKEYGVVIKQSVMEIDWEATNKLREGN
ncbi:MAG: hydantoinase B/oxoprolinase family protein [Bacillota bacterium]